MILIAHRGNTHGKSEKENHPDYIQGALDAGYNVEVDVWCIRRRWSLGHDEPQYSINKSYLQIPKVWWHAKTITTFKYLLDIGLTCFFHENDDAALTSNGYIWTFPGKILTKKSICVLPEEGVFPKKCAGICSDYINKHKGIL